MKGYVGIYDLDADYTSKLAEAMVRRKVFSLEVVEFTESEKVRKFLKTNRLELLLISSEALTEELEEENIGKVILLEEEIPSQERRQEAAKNNFGVVFKYQSVTNLSKEILLQFKMSFGISKISGLSQSHCTKQIIGVYSPIKRCLKTSFSVALAQLSGERQATLLLNFEEFSGMGSLIFGKEKENAEGNLSDVLYYLLQKELNEKAEVFIRSFHSFDYILPARCPEDIRGLKPDEVIELVRHFAEKTAYQCIVIDFGDALSGTEQIMKCCTKIYMPVKDDLVSVIKKQEYLDYVTDMHEELLEIITEVKPPYQHMFCEGTELNKNSDYFGQLLSGAFYDYVRQMI